MATSNFPTPEIFTLLEERVKDYVRQEGRAEGRAEGRQEGLKEGFHKGLLMAVRAVLQSRFGALPAAIIARLDAAGPEQLERWIAQASTAPTLDAALQTH
jgi:predicted transposase YdaD